MKPNWLKSTAGRKRLLAMRSSFSGVFAVLLVLGGVVTQPAQAEVRLPRVFGSHMVLQEGKPLVFWGWAQPNETVSISFAGENRQAQANERGEWKAILPAMNAGGPFTVSVSGSSTVQFDDV